MFPPSIRRDCIVFSRLAVVVFMAVFSSAVSSRAQKFNETILYSFTNTPDGSYPVAGVIVGQDGSLYGTTAYGGTNNNGLLFKINRDGSGYRELYAFQFNTGGNPYCLLQAADGFLYGTAANGGSNLSGGAIFTINTNGTGYRQLHAFSTTDGQYPSSAFFLGSNGVLYGATSQGGISNAGTVFRLNLDGSNFQLLHQFTNTPDGADPAGIIQGVDGALYGVTAAGGVSNAGIVFRLTTNGNSYSVLHNFTNSPDGADPEANLIQGKDGMLYGTTIFGGSTYTYGGTLFKLNTNGSGYAVMHSFPSIAGDGTNPESLFQASDGTLYGVAANSGAFGSGMVFAAGTNGNFTVLYGFTNSPPDGRNPVSPLVDGGDGAFYGTADHGGVFDQGTVFRLTPPLTLAAQISTVAGTNIAILSWPAWAANYAVRSSPTLTNTSWASIGAPVTNSGKLYATNKSTAPTALFRLQTGP